MTNKKFCVDLHEISREGLLFSSHDVCQTSQNLSATKRFNLWNLLLDICPTLDALALVTYSSLRESATPAFGPTIALLNLNVFL